MILWCFRCFQNRTSLWAGIRGRGAVNSVFFWVCKTGPSSAVFPHVSSLEGAAGSLWLSLGVIRGGGAYTDLNPPKVASRLSWPTRALANAKWEELGVLRVWLLLWAPSPKSPPIPPAGGVQLRPPQPRLPRRLREGSRSNSKNTREKRRKRKGPKIRKSARNAKKQHVSKCDAVQKSAIFF